MIFFFDNIQSYLIRKGSGGCPGGSGGGIGPGCGGGRDGNRPNLFSIKERRSSNLSNFSSHFYLLKY
ncbi:unnamed protein product, partial [marine sediment metagenome]